MQEKEIKIRQVDGIKSMQEAGIKICKRQENKVLYASRRNKKYARRNKIIQETGKQTMQAEGIKIMQEDAIKGCKLK